MSRGPLASLRAAARLAREGRRRAGFLVRAGASDATGADAREWLRYCRTVAVDPNLVLYQTHSGSAMACNPFAIFDELLHDPDFARLKHVWVLDSYAEIERRTAQYAAYPGVRFVRFKTAAYRKALAAAGYLIQNAVFPAYFTKRPGQVYVNSWHSPAAVKKMGFDAPRGNFSSRNVLRDLMMADYLIAPNELATRMYADSYRLRGLYPGGLLEEGYPRCDTTVNTRREDVLEELRSRGVRVDPAKQVILYAPTWRGTIGNVRAGADELRQVRTTLESLIDTDRYQVLIKPHTFHYNRLPEQDKVSGEFVPRHMNTNALLAAVDILISDYSSIFFDFMVTGRPILFYIPDLEEYSAERGLYFTADELPGPVTADLADLAASINHIDQTTAAHAESYQRLARTICAHEDGRATRRTVDVVFRGLQPPGGCGRLDQPSRIKVLMHTDELDDSGVTESLLALAGGLDPARYDVTVSCGDDRVGRANIERVTNARVFVKAAGSALTGWEARGLDYLRRYGPDKVARGLNLAPVLEREWHRRFGDARFDVVVDCSPSPGVFAWMAKQASGAQLLFRQHTDVVAQVAEGEQNVVAAGPHPVSRAALGAIYRAADAVVVPSRTLMPAAKGAFRGVKFVAAAGLVDAQRLRDLVAEARLWRQRWSVRDGLIVADVTTSSDGSVRMQQLNDEPPAPESGQPYRRFVTIGTLSAHKNLPNLIAGFAKFLTEYPNSRLFVVGSGPALGAARRLAARPELVERIVFTGHLRNPFTVLDLADCFVLPLRYEGLAVAVTEARLLGLPIVLAGTDTGPPVFVPNGQFVTGFEPDDLLEGLLAFVEGRVPNDYVFDLERHNAQARRQWDAVLTSDR